MKTTMKFWLCVFCMITTVFLTSCSRQDERLMKYASLNPERDFTLTDQDGKPFHLKDARGKIVFLFFGYLSCPDICPTTISKLSKVYSLLGANKDKALTVFISVDPQRDTPQRLKEYLSYFKIKALGLTGSKAHIDLVVDAYKASYEKVETGLASGYLYNHSDYVYVIDQDGMVRYLIRQDDKPDQIVKVVNVLL